MKPIRAQEREGAIGTIQALYDIDSETGKRLLLDVVLDMGFDALSDKAVFALRERHWTEEERNVNAALRKSRSIF